MAILVKELTNNNILDVSHKGKEYNMKREENGKIYVPFAFGRVLTKDDPLIEIQKGNKINFKLVLRDNQIGPCMNIKVKLDKQGYCLLGLDCADGKTVLMIHTISNLSPKLTLVVTHRKPLRDQIAKEIKEKTGEEVWVAEKPAEVSSGARIILCTILKVPKLPESIRNNVDLLVVDECDCIGSKKYTECLMTVTPKRLLGMTATFDDFKTGSQHRALELLYGTTPITSAEHKPYKVLRVETIFKPKVVTFWDWKKKKHRTNWSILYKSLACMYERNAYCCIIIKYFLEASSKNKIAVLRKEVAYIEPQKVKEVKRKRKVLTEDEKETKRLLSGKPAAKTKPKKEKAVIPYEQQLKESLHIHLEKIYPNYQKVYGTNPKVVDSRVFVGTYSKMQAGFDCRGLPGFDGNHINVVIELDDVEDCRQTVGRGLRSEDPLIIEFIDDNDILRGHARNRAKYHEGRGAKITTTHQNEIEWEVESDED